MRILRRTAAMTRLVERERCAGNRVGFVPTMGYLHEGHLHLVRRARKECDRVVASIFVNPLQFGPGEDFEAYPRDPRRDHRLLKAEGVDWLFEPGVEEFYPQGFSTRVSVEGLDQPLCGRHRPGHFTGVATVVAKLLLACRPHRLYLGKKDFQQMRVLDRMARDLNLGVQVVPVPTVRDKDGLAMSSRNVYLSTEERAWAPSLYRALRETAAEIRSGRVRTPEAAERGVEKRIKDGPGRLEYVEALRASDLQRTRRLEGTVVVALAYRLGRARLIDNIEVRAGGRGRI